ncbi:hypothetical protein CKAN_00634700 [Cinnamomum micranthum f. kanehirae]|uniref:Uncharacterized protein n=1 Tax=Cinnamomum micranthum f. kanehirae TaxID=337451 RepID=A0A3S3M6A8_9MAGN|nr:hypothetical protein CKAN_00634700 [Cinnamomum micranthum f. kanehirae]
MGIESSTIIPHVTTLLVDEKGPTSHSGGKSLNIAAHKGRGEKKEKTEEPARERERKSFLLHLAEEKAPRKGN